MEVLVPGDKTGSEQITGTLNLKYKLNILYVQEVVTNFK